MVLYHKQLIINITQTVYFLVGSFILGVYDPKNLKEFLCKYAAFYATEASVHILKIVLISDLF